MIISINDSETLIVATALANLYSKRERQLTLFLMGIPGIGKTAIVKSAAKRMNGKYFVLDVSLLSQGEIGGIPFPPKDENSDSYEFAKHKINGTIKRVQRYIFEKAKSTGFLNGRLKLLENGDTKYIDKNGKITVYPATSKIDKIFDGTDNDNKYEFGENLSGDIKYELLLNEEIKICFILLDEANRSDIQTQKEIMNYILAHEINGYKLPWWVNMVATGNPANTSAGFATNTFDPAQFDRFIMLGIRGDLKEFNSYALKNKLNLDMLNALNSNPKLMILEDKKSIMYDQDEHKDEGGTPRSWEMVSTLMNYVPKFIATAPYFSSEEIKNSDTYLMDLIAGKVGDVTATTFFATMKNAKDWIRPSEIINGNDSKVDPEIMKKFRSQEEIHKKFTLDSLLYYLCEFIASAKKLREDKDTEKRLVLKKSKAQIKEFFTTLDPVMKKYLGKQIVNTEEFKLSDEDSSLYVEIADCFDTDFLNDIRSFKEQIKKMQ